MGSARAATMAETTWTGATSIGQGRALSIAMLLAAILLAIILAVAWLRGRAGRASSLPDAGAPPQVVTGPRLAAEGAAGQGPYATLAATSGPVPPSAEAAWREEGSTPD